MSNNTRSSPGDLSNQPIPAIPLVPLTSSLPGLVPLTSSLPASVPLANATTSLSAHISSAPTSAKHQDEAPRLDQATSRPRGHRRHRNGPTFVTASGQVILCSDESADEETSGKTSKLVRGISARAELRKRLKRRSWKHDPQTEPERRLSKQHRLGRSALKEARLILADKEAQRTKLQETLLLWSKAKPTASSSESPSKAQETCGGLATSFFETERSYRRCFKGLEDTEIAIEFLKAHINTLQLAITKHPEILVLLKLENTGSTR